MSVNVCASCKMLDVATRPEDMNLAGLYFHSLHGMAQERWSVRVSAKFRVTFGWSTEQAIEIDLKNEMLHEILAERKPLSEAMCLKIAKLFGSSPEMWMRLQAANDLKRAPRM